MKSKLTFDLNSQNKAVILAKVELTEDVRDKIASRFRENFGINGCLATISYFPSNQDNSEFEITPYSASFKDSLEIAYLMSHDQLHEMLDAIRVELYNREKGIFDSAKKITPPANWMPEPIKKAED